MTGAFGLVSATPVLASMDIGRSVAFFESKLGFKKIYAEQGQYGIVASGAIELHFWACTDRKIAEATGCRVRVEGIDALYAQCVGQAIVHPNAALEAKPWGSKEFAILDPDGNLVTFFEDSAPDLNRPSP